MSKDDHRSAIEGAVQHLAPPLAHAAQAILIAFGVTLSTTWTIPIVSAFGLYGFYLFYKQDELNKFMTWIKEHPSEFAETVVQEPAFQDGFMITLEEYLKARSEEKREMIKSIFLGFASEEEKENFELERMYETIRLISKDQLKALRLFKNNNYLNFDIDGDRSSIDYRMRQESKSLESLGLAIVEMESRIENQDEMEGDMESGFQSTGRLESYMKRSDWAELTSFGRRFMDFCGLRE